MLGVAVFTIAQALTRNDSPSSPPTISTSAPPSSASALPTRLPKDPVADIADTPVNTRAILHLRPCTASGLALAVKSESNSYDNGQNPQIMLTVHRDPATGPACRIDLGRTTTILTMTDTNVERLWSSGDCPGTYTTPRWAKLAGSTPVTVTFHWDRRLTRPHCATATGAARPGTYVSEAELAGHTARTSFLLKADTTVTSTPSHTSSSGSTNGGTTGGKEGPSVSTSVTTPTGTCKSGFVWREATADDHVCVTPGTRAQAQDDNAHAASRQVSATDPTCVSGYVWREATASDLVCVTPGTRDQAKDDNAHAADRVVS
jgi:hypothetical protein